MSLSKSYGKDWYFSVSHFLEHKRGVGEYFLSVMVFQEHECQ